MTTTTEMTATLLTYRKSPGPIDFSGSASDLYPTATIPVTVSIPANGVPQVLDADGRIIDLANLDAGRIDISARCDSDAAAAVLSIRAMLATASRLRVLLPQLATLPLSAGVVHVGEAGSDDVCDYCEQH